MENGRWIILIVGYIPLWEDSQWYVRKPTPELAEDCQLCWWKCEKRIILLICSYHCERIHRSISWNLRQNWQRIASSVGGSVRKRIILLIVHTTVRGFTGAYYETYVRTDKGLPVLTEKQNYTTVCSYHCERIHRSISWNLCQNWQRTASFDEGRWVKKEPHNWLCKYHCERIHNGIYITMKPTSELKKDF